MADSSVPAHRQTTERTSLTSWFVVLAVVVCLAVVPGVIVGSVYLGLLPSLALFRGTSLALFVMVPGIVLGATAVLVMLGPE